MLLIECCLNKHSENISENIITSLSTCIQGGASRRCASSFRGAGSHYYLPIERHPSHCSSSSKRMVGGEPNLGRNQGTHRRAQKAPPYPPLELQRQTTQIKSDDYISNDHCVIKGSYNSWCPTDNARRPTARKQRDPIRTAGCSSCCLWTIDVTQTAVILF